MMAMPGCEWMGGDDEIDVPQERGRHHSRAARRRARVQRSAHRLPDDHGGVRVPADEFIDGVEFGGAAAFLSDARKAHITLFV